MTFDDEISEHRINSAIIYCCLFLLFLKVENEIKTAYLYSATITLCNILQCTKICMVSYLQLRHMCAWLNGRLTWWLKCPLHKTQNCLLCSSLALHVPNQGWSWLWLPFLSPFSSSSLSSRYTFSINNLHLHLYYAVSLSYSHFFICHIFHGTGRLVLTYSKNSLYVRVAGNIPGILTQDAIQFCSSKFFSCFVQPSISTA